MVAPRKYAAGPSVVADSWAARAGYYSSTGGRVRWAESRA